MRESIFPVSVPSMLESIFDGVGSGRGMVVTAQERLILGQGHRTTDKGQGKRERKR